MQHPRAMAAFAGGISAAAVGLVAYHYVSFPIVAIVALLGGAFGYLEIMWQKTVELRATNLEFQTTGYFRGSYRSKRAVPRANIRLLKYRAESGGLDAYEPGGLYAGLKLGSACILPYLDEKQTQTVIEAIYKRFPDMLTTAADSKSPFGQHFTTLGI